MCDYNITKLPNDKYVYHNVLLHHNEDFGNSYLIINDSIVYPSIYVPIIDKKSIALGSSVRNKMNLTFMDKVNVKKYEINKDNRLDRIQIMVSLINRKKSIILHEDVLKDNIRKDFNNYYFYNNQSLLYLNNNIQLVFDIKLEKQEGFLKKNTLIELITSDINLNLVGSKLLKRELFKDDYNFEEIGIGGLDKELLNIFRRALATRAMSPNIIEKLGVNHVKGILLYGPPGTGKTLTAMKIGCMITDHAPKIVRGPEIMNKFIGESEKNIRELFSDAINDYEMYKEKSKLHVIIFDEIDAICRKRGGSLDSSRVYDGIVNMLLSMLDGPLQLKNVFVIAMTNRKDLLDEALLRAGRIEVHIQIGLPDQKGREEIFRIHTNKMRLNNMIDKYVDYNYLSTLTENFSGAEIEAVVKNASSRALHRELVSVKEEIQDSDIIVTVDDFVNAIKEIEPSFGNINKKIKELIPKSYKHLTNIHEDCYNEIINYLKQEGVYFKKILIKGDSNCGKTSLVGKICYDSKINHIKFIRAIDLINFDEFQKSQHIIDIAKNSYISKDSLIVIDDIEIAVNFAQFGNTLNFSNRLYQTILTILKTAPPNGHNLTIIVTTNNENFSSNISYLFDKNYEINNIY